MFVSNHPVSIDISMDDNRHGGVKCVDFVKKVMDRYKFLKEIVVVLKHLLFICNFHEKFSGGLTSYALFLMIASYLQNCEQYPMTFYEAFVGVLNYYVNVFDYLTDIRVLDPDLASIEWQG